jgi:hypothetical protein
MNNIKTYEGFLNLFRSKNKKSIGVTHWDIIDCFWTLIDDNRIGKHVNSDGNYVDSGIFKDTDEAFGFTVKQSDRIENISHITFCRNIALFEFWYNNQPPIAHYERHLPPISNHDLIDLVKECEDRLKEMGLKVSYFICWGYDEGGCSSKEWNNFEQMIEYLRYSGTNITMKIKSESAIVP